MSVVTMDCADPKSTSILISKDYMQFSKIPITQFRWCRGTDSHLSWARYVLASQNRSIGLAGECIGLHGVELY